MTREFQTTFGALPVGTAFERTVWDKDPADRRRKTLVRWYYTKTSHGMIAGFAKGPHGAWRSGHRWPVYVDGSDLRLVVACACSEYHRTNNSVSD